MASEKIPRCRNCGLTFASHSTSLLGCPTNRVSSWEPAAPASPTGEPPLNTLRSLVKKAPGEYVATFDSGSALPEGPWFGCFTGDCPHETQADCDAAIRAECATMERTIASLEAERTLTLREMQQINAARSVRWMAGSPGWTTLEIAGELAGEVGELANVCKKLRRSELGVPGNKVSDDVLRLIARGEIGDVLIVLMLTASKLGVDLHEAVCDAFNAKSEQMGFPERFTSTVSGAGVSQATQPESPDAPRHAHHESAVLPVDPEHA